MVFNTPTGSCKNDAFLKDLSVGVDYATADINSTSDLTVNFETEVKDGEEATGMFPYKSWGINSLNAFKVDDCFNVGFGISNAHTTTVKGEDDKEATSFNISALKLGSTYKCGDMMLMAAINATLKTAAEEWLAPGQLAASMFQQVDKQTNVA